MDKTAFFLKTFIPLFLVSLIQKLPKSGFDGREIIKTHLKSPFSYFFFLLFGGFQTLESLFPPGLSALVASLSAFLLTIPGDKRTDLCLFAAVRALNQLISPNLSKFTKSVVYLATFQLSSWHIMYAWFYYPETLPKSYNQWISRLSRMDRRVLNVLKENKDGKFITYGEGLPLPKDLKEYAEGFGLNTDYRGYLPCYIVHRGVEGCLNHTLTVFKNGISDSVKIYLPLNILMVLLNYKKGIKIGVALKNTSRSCCFLASFISIIWATICISRHTFNKKDLQSGPVLATFLCGFSCLIENGERRKQLALYTLPKALESFLEIRIPKGFEEKCVGFVYPVQAVIFSISTAYLLREFRVGKEKEKGMEKGLINSIFKFFLADLD